MVLKRLTDLIHLLAVATYAALVLVSLKVLDAWNKPLSQRLEALGCLPRDNLDEQQQEALKH